MTLELHIWGPAFDLPSIDPECLAAIIYIDSGVSSGDYVVVVPDGDPLANPHGELPALRVDGDDGKKTRWVVGYRDIVSFVRDKEEKGEDLNARQNADGTAFTEYIRIRGRELIDLSLWVSSENYTSVTRSAVHEILTWPGSWTVPGVLRDRARKRTEHLGFSGIDVDVAAEEQARKDRESRGLEAHIPSSLKRASKGVSQMWRQGSRGHHFKLAALADGFLGGIAELKGTKKYLLGTESMTAADALALGYLVLMQKADVPHDWLGFALRERHPQLLRWAEDETRHLFGIVDNTLRADSETRLQWRQPQQRTWHDVATSALANFTASLPIIGPVFLHPTIPDDSRTEGQTRRKQQTLLALKGRQLWYGKILASCLSATAVGGLLLWAGMLHLPRFERSLRASRRDFGAAGAMLGLG